MLRKLSAGVAILLLLGGVWIMPASAGVPRVAVAEEFGATW